MATTTNGVYISNVDDYVSPSQACINPIFTAPAAKTKPAATATVQQTEQQPESVLPRRQRRKRTALVATGAVTTAEDDSKEQQEEPDSAVVTVQASLADCLACSGCVTTTETVLMEQQHSIEVLRELLWNTSSTTPKKFVLTLSPAAWADLVRHLELPPADSVLRQFTTVVYQLLGISLVVDGNVPLLWSLHEAAEEFCRSYRSKNTSMSEVPLYQTWQDELWPSQALSQHELQFRSPHDGSIHTVDLLDEKPRSVPTKGPPLVSSSCPAVVCLVEKTAHAAVPHLSTVPSAMSLAGAHLQRHSAVYHIAVMPCHDKKLEASRKDFMSHNNHQHVDMVLTTHECLSLLHEGLERKKQQQQSPQSQDNNNNNNTPLMESLDAWLKQEILQAPLAPVSQTLPTATNGNDEPPQGGGLLWTTTTTTDAPLSSTKDNDNDSSPFVYGSGGYADYIFRHACRELFGVALENGPLLPWQPVSSHPNNTKNNTSARMAAAAQRRKKDFYQITLYSCRRPGNDDTEYYYTTTKPDETTVETKPVLKFALAYGMQTLQRVLKPFQQQGDNNNAESAESFDYIEAMACPSGCLNGGGQLRLSPKETPTETRKRLDQTQELFTRPPILNALNTNIPLEPRDLHTTYHVVPPMQLSMGAAAGVAVQDLQW